jgi:predicted PurR-regulated permease PerM
MRLERHVVFWIVALIAAVLVVGLLRDVLLPFIVAIIIAYALNPTVDWLVRRGLSRTIASGIILAIGMAIFTVLLINVAPLLLNQAQKLALALPEQIQQLRTVVESLARDRLGPRFPEFAAALDSAAKSLTDNWTSLAGSAAKSLLNQTRSIFNAISLVLITPLVAFYILVDWYPMLGKIDGWLPRDQAPTIRALAAQINQAIAAFIRGQGIVCLILALFYASMLSFVGLEYGLLVGLATGIMSFVPFVGWALGLLTALGLAVVQFWPQTTPIGLVGLVFVGGQLLDAAFLSPGIVGSKIGLHPVWLLFALLVFSYLFGFVGVLVAVPVAAAIAVLVRFGLKLYLASDVYQGTASAKGPQVISSTSDTP